MGFCYTFFSEFAYICKCHNIGVRRIPFSRGSRDLGIEPMFLTLLVVSSPSEPPGKPSKTIGRNKSLLRDRKRLYWLSCMSSNKGATHRALWSEKMEWHLGMHSRSEKEFVSPWWGIDSAPSRQKWEWSYCVRGQPHWSAEVEGFEMKRNERWHWVGWTLLFRSFQIQVVRFANLISKCLWTTQKS